MLLQVAIQFGYQNIESAFVTPEEMLPWMERSELEGILNRASKSEAEGGVGYRYLTDEDDYAGSGAVSLTPAVWHCVFIWHCALIWFCALIWHYVNL